MPKNSQPLPTPKPRDVCKSCGGNRTVMEIDTRTGFAKLVKCERCNGTGNEPS